MYKYINTFHNTSAESKYSPADFRAAAEYRYARSPGFYRAHLERILAAGKRLRRRLCWVSGCSCSNWYGERAIFAETQARQLKDR
jgi:hypothetical protein